MCKGHLYVKFGRKLDVIWIKYGCLINCNKLKMLIEWISVYKPKDDDKTTDTLINR